ncbi:MAG: hypothetical protein WBM58_01350, partial [Sedimenticolaceae bacterium]
VLTDDNKTPNDPSDDFNPIYVEGDDGDGLLEVGENWIYTASETAGEGLNTNIGTVTGITASGQTTIAVDLANYTGLTAPSGDIGFEGQAVCDIEGKADAILFEYNPGTTLNTLQDSDKAAILFNNGVDDDGTSFIVVTDEDDAAKALSGDGKQFFRGNVAFGDTFLADETTYGDDSFGSATYIHFYDSASGGLLQSITYHTSCSQPIRLGDVVGNATLVGYDGDEDAGISLISLPEPVDPVDPPPMPEIELPQVDASFDVNNIGVTGDTAPGPVANLGDIVTFTYEVTNTGNVDLTIDDLVDDNATPDDTSDDFTPEAVLKEGGLNFGDENSDGIFNPGETWYFQSKELGDRPGLNTNIVKVTAEDDVGTMVMADDPANYLINPLDIQKLVAVEPIGGAEPGLMVCETEGKPVTMKFEYDPSVIFDTMQDSGKGTALVSGTLTDGSIDDDGVSYIVITDDDDASDGIDGDVFFAGIVAEGDQFSASVANAGSSFSSNTYFYFFDDQGGPLLQSAKYHTSCSAPIILGDGILSATLIGYEGEDSTGMVSLPSPVFVDADTLSTAPEAVIGTEVKYQYLVNNLGTEALTDVAVSDDKLGDLERVSGDDNNNGKLDADETWIYTASATAEKGPVTNVATASAMLTGVDVVDTDAANYLGIKLPAPTGDLTDLFDKPTAMAFTYLPDAPVIDASGKDKDGDGLGDQDGDAKIEENNGVDGDGTSYIVVTKFDKINDIQKGLADGDKVYFAGDVEFGQSFLADIDFRAEDKFENDTRIWIFDDNPFDVPGETVDLLSVTKFKTDGSQPIEYGDIFGSAQVVEYQGKSGQGYDDPEIDFGYDTFNEYDPWTPADNETPDFDLQFVELMGVSSDHG